MAASRTARWIALSLRNAETSLLRWLFGRPPQTPLAAPCGLALDSQVEKQPAAAGPSLGSLLDGILLAVPRNRRSLERRLTRKHGMEKHFENAIPRNDLVVCLECGSWHEKHTICGKCYEKVREETKEMMKAMGDDLTYHVPRKEVAFVYHGEEQERPKHKGKFIVEMKRPRPSWFPKNLMTPTKE